MIKNYLFFVVFALFNALVATTAWTGILSPSSSNFPLYVANDGNNAIVQFDASGNQTVNTSIASTNPQIGLSYPEGIAFDTSDNLYVAVDSNAQIVKVDLSGFRPQTVFYQDTSGLLHPTSLAFDKSGNLYVVSGVFSLQANNPSQILKLDPQGNPTVFFSNNNAQGIILCDPIGAAFDTSGNLYVGNEGPSGTSSTILKIDPNGHATVFSSGNLLGAIAEMAFGVDGNLYVADSPTFNTSNPVILKIDPNGNQTVFSSNNSQQGMNLSNPGGLAFDSSGNLYVANYNAGSTGIGTIVKLDSQGKQTVFASGNHIYYPYGLAFTPFTYNFSGWLASIANPPTVNYGKAGRTYPVKWKLATNNAYVTQAKNIWFFRYKKVPAATFAADPTLVLPDSSILAGSPGDTGIRYDDTDQQFIFNWQTPSESGSYELDLVLPDSGQSFPAQFNLQ
jgi:sugar lactone lactonase YvrE